jgi:hypothetical protein
MKGRGIWMQLCSRLSRIMRKRGAADAKGTGKELGEIMIYAFLEES